MSEQIYSTILFDWGDTVMYDDPTSIAPMVEWAGVRVVEGLVDVLEDLRASGKQIILATGALSSD